MKPVILLFGTVLDWFYRYTGDYGLAIVCLTVLVKLCLLPLYGAHRGRTDERQAGAGSCLLLLVTLPVLTGLYRTVLAGAAGPVGSCLCPWIASLLSRDPYGLLPAMSAVVQLLPQTYPYLSFFRALELPKAPKGMLVSSALLTFLICLPLPSAVGIYYLTSGILTAAEQAVQNGLRAYRLRCA